MSCCGNKRNAWLRNDAVHSHRTEAPHEYEKMREAVSFEYTGATAVTVTGSISGKKYRFLFTGDRQLVEYRDAPGMMAVPVLRKVKN